METIAKQLEAGNLYLLGSSIENSSKEWNSHPVFIGVALKHLVTGAQTDGQFSAHIVKVNPNCILDEHIHYGKTEMHEVVVGSGLFVMGSLERKYLEGDMAIIPANTKHKVIAGNEGIYLLAKFVPALL